MASPRFVPTPSLLATAEAMVPATETIDAPPLWLLEEGLDLEEHPLYDTAKRVLDFVVALLGVLVLSPVILLIAIAIKLDSKGPVFFKQERLGKGTRRFTMIKFRSMYIDGDARIGELAALNEATGPLFKMRRDPRITRVGRILRRTSLDELPQLFNVLSGKMSVVGPRPPLPRELTGFDDIQRARLRVLPGLTGLWQVSGRSDLPFAEMVRLDMEYIERRSVLLDLRIIVMTVPSVVLGVGAY
jgi:exopolysaccharide biosynthesis polyprenyl glycosylphosphotransferase